MKSSASESKAFQSRSKGEIPGRARRKERLFQIETGVPNWFRRRTFHVLNSMYLVRLMKSTVSEPGLTSWFFVHRICENILLSCLIIMPVLLGTVFICLFPNLRNCQLYMWCLNFEGKVNLISGNDFKLGLFVINMLWLPWSFGTSRNP